MDDNRAMFLVGGALTIFGVLLVVSHLRGRRKVSAETSAANPTDATDEFERRHLAKRFRRRLQTSALIALLGLLIALHPLVIPDPKFAPKLFATWWIAALLVALWIILMAFGDILSTRAHLQVARARLGLQQRQLRRQLDELRARRGDKGSEE